MTLSPQWLDELRSRTLLSALVGRTVKLTKAGREFRACCPFHNEKTPSFYVNDEKGFYHCFGCSAHGDAIRWMTDQRGLPFMDAIKELAQAAGMDVPAPDPRAAEHAERANSLFDVMTAAAEWFSSQLQGIDGAHARTYLEARGLRQEWISTFGIGFAPDSKSKLKQALGRFGTDKLVESGLLIAVDDKEPYDRFRGRIMIPIRDARGRVIAFGGRVLGSGEPKYLNSPDTALFDKGRTLYNLDRAAAFARKAGRIIVVEGYMDVIALAQAGIGEVVAPLGTALTEHQIALLWRQADVPILCFDGDAAGQKAGLRAALRALPHLAPAKSLSFSSLPKGQDPDDVVRHGGPRALEALLAEPEPLVDLLWRSERDAAPLRTPEDRAGFRQRLNSHVQVIGHGDVRGQYQAEFRARFDTLLTVKSAPRATTGARQPYQVERPLSSRTRSIGGGGVTPVFARAILAGLIRHPAMILTCADALSLLSIEDPDLDRMRLILLDAAYDGVMLDSDALVPICNAAGLGELAVSLMDSNGLAFSFTRRQADAEIARRDLGMAIEALAARPALDAALAAATARLAEKWDEGGFAEQMRLVEALGDADRRLAALAQGEDE